MNLINRIDTLFDHITFDELWNTGFKNQISTQVKQIRSGLNDFYARGELEKLFEIKSRLVEIMYLSFSSIHGGIDGILSSSTSEDGFVIASPKKMNEIDQLIRTNRFKQTHVKALIDLIDGYRFIASYKPATEVKMSPKHDYIASIEDAVKSDEAHKNVLDILILAELIDKDTYNIKDKAKGNKGFFYSTIQLFFEKGYFKRRPLIEEYLNICNNSFNVGISKSTARNIKTLKGTDIIVPPFVS